MVVIAGIDLAWSGRKPTGVCVIRAEAGVVRLEQLCCIGGTAEDVAELLLSMGDDVVAGIDAPLIVGPARRAEAELARAYGSRGVFAYAARMDFLERHGIVEGPALGARLAERGWSLSPGELAQGAIGRYALEVFPHATIVSLLGAEFALKYKKGSRAKRLGPLVAFQGLLRAYAERELPCLLTEAAAGILTEPVELLTVRALKNLEDRFDAIACAIAAYHAWKIGAAGLEVFGDDANGYIAVPRPVTSFPAPSSP
jgi:predicted RNase H-like nuclease